MNSTQKITRIAGILYLLIAICGPFSMMYVPGALLVPGDAATTAFKIKESTDLLRASLVSDSIIFLSEIVLVVLLYTLLKTVDKTLALAATYSRLGMAIMVHLLATHQRIW